MNHAKNNPVNRPGRELHTDDMEVGQRPAVNLDLPREAESILPVEGALSSDYLEELAFNEEPVTINIQKSSEKFAPNVVDCWCGGRGAEQFINGKWAVCGWLPVNKPVTTRRKYVEVLARSKQDSIQTRTIKHEESEDNFADRYTNTKYPFSVLRDSEKGHQWLSKVLMEG